MNRAHLEEASGLKPELRPYVARVDDLARGSCERKYRALEELAGLARICGSRVEPDWSRCSANPLAAAALLRAMSELAAELAAEERGRGMSDAAGEALAAAGVSGQEVA